MASGVRRLTRSSALKSRFFSCVMSRSSSNISLPSALGWGPEPGGDQLFICAILFHRLEMLVDLGHEVLVLMPGIDSHNTAVPDVRDSNRRHRSHGIAHGRQRGDNDIKTTVF